MRFSTTHDGGHVAVQTTREGDLLVLRVIDSGIGIAEADLPHVFDRLHRADRVRVSVTGPISACR